MAPITVHYRLRIPVAGQAAFARAWSEALRAIVAGGHGALGGRLLQVEGHPDALLVETRWESRAAWCEFWSKGPPEPQGDPACNELMSELAAVWPRSEATEGGTA